MADIVLINPRFDVSYWGLEHALPFLHVKAILPTASLPLLAALTPAGHHVQLIDENVEEIDFDRCARADLVGVTGMNVQRRRMREILWELKQTYLGSIPAFWLPVAATISPCRLVLQFNSLLPTCAWRHGSATHLTCAS